MFAVLPTLRILQQLLVLRRLPSTSGHFLYVMSVVIGIAGFTLLFIEKESIFTLVSTAVITMMGIHNGLLNCINCFQFHSLNITKESTLGL